MIYLNRIVVEFGQFPNKEINLPTENLKLTEINLITFQYEDDSDIFKLILLKSWVNSMNCKSNLYISYLPYSRMDRVNGIYAVSLLAFTEIINNMGFGIVYVREPHSDVTLENINNIEVDNWVSDRLEDAIKMSRADTLFFPDEGARDRYNTEDLSINSAHGYKRRSFDTGNIDDYKIKGDVGYNVLIVDDLCSRGGTFIAASKLLKSQGANHVELIVAHCENNVFTGDVFNYIDKIYTSKEMLDEDHPRIIKMD